MKIKALSLTMALAMVALAGGASAQSLTTQERVDARNFIAAQGVGFCSQNLYQRTGWSGGQKVAVVPVYDRTFDHVKVSTPTHLRVTTIRGAAVANECSDAPGKPRGTASDD